MSSVLRYGVCKLLARNSVAGLCKTTLNGKANATRIQVAFISGKALRVVEQQRPPPYPYETKKYSYWNELFDGTLHRMDENSKIIVVEGPIASGKTAFAQVLAADLGMRYMPAVTMDAEYINEYGYDCRQLDPQLPPSCRSYDVKNFCTDPHHENCAYYQVAMYYHRYSQYVDALAHLFSTGQGIVLERCAFSDFIFLEAMHRAGYISKAARTTYSELQARTMREILLPHLVIYLDVPVPIVQANIKKRGIPYEVNSKVFTSEYLSNIEKLYKQEYLKEIAKYANILIYDWTDGGDTEVVIEDIEQLNFDITRDDDMKFRDWNFWNESDWCSTRRLYADEKLQLMSNFVLGGVQAPEMYRNAHDDKIFNDVWYSAPGNRYIKDFNKEMGDTGILWKSPKDYRQYRPQSFD